MIKQYLSEKNLKAKLMHAFRVGEIRVQHKDAGGQPVFTYPRIHEAKQKGQEIHYIFTLPHGLKPDKVHEKKFVFQQIYGEYVEIEGKFKEFTLKAYKGAVSLHFPYGYEDIKEHLTGYRIPIYCGYDKQGHAVVFDLAKHPHLLPAGETGSGKSSFLRVMLCTLIQHMEPEKLRLVLCDMKRSEFGMFRNVAHCDGVHMKKEEVLKAAKKIRKELDMRGDLFDEHEVVDIEEYNEMFPEKREPYIIFAIDEVAMLKKEADLMQVLEEISAIGRALGIFLVLSMQRPDSKLLEGALKNNMTVRAGFKCSDGINSSVIGVDGCEDLPEPGRMILKTNAIQEVQCPNLEPKAAKELLARYKVARVYEEPKQPEKDESIRSWGVEE